MAEPIRDTLTRLLLAAAAFGVALAGLWLL
jgi:hypothetical protein